ncbi:MAG: glutamine synthetase type III [Candidatus Altiarchaeales archaeon]|nr:glutamine synthetase type III [Candidatus Altiarchaeales archaeon]MBD3416071.1 glutamine synthetase type III [Candidatus Altiarchaeales archaeon]
MVIEKKMREEAKIEKEMLERYGENVFSFKAMKQFLPEKVYKTLKNVIDKGEALPEGIADDVAEGIKKWAISKGAFHYTHWFQPMTGATAEKHDSLIHPTEDGGAIFKFSGKELTQGEPDASSFPSGGIRATFEARGYTAWDPTSPAFIKYTEEGPTLCIPTAFVSYTGEALDKKTPLLRSMEALSKSTRRLIKLFDGKVPDRRAFATLGPEQEYFLIDREFYLARPDLVMCGRTLFGNCPPKHQQMDDHYFGSIKPRVLAFMEEVDRECWKLGIPAKTRHNEVSPAQFEIAPVFEELNLSVDHNMMVMQILKETAEKHGLVCLLHEKPFAGVNGSGKHNNWSLSGPDGKNLLNPGDSPHENAKFLTMVCAVIRAVDKYQKLLRASVATAGNDHRLGANEAPPAIVSIFLGDQLTDIIEQVEKGGAKASKANDKLTVGVTSLPELPKDVTDRNRTSPFAFTGTKFEFRMVGSTMSCAGPNLVLNTIVAESLDYISDEIEKAMGRGEKVNEALQRILQKIVKEHKRIIFNGDNYTSEWEQEAEKRGLANIKTSDEALKAIVTPENTKLFEKYCVFSEKELKSRYEILHEQYEMAIDIEGRTSLDMAKTMILPAALKYQKKVAKSAAALKAAGGKGTALVGMKKHVGKLSELTAQLYAGMDKLEKAIEKGKPPATIKAMSEVRNAVDQLEAEVDERLWPLPKYREMLFIY